MFYIYLLLSLGCENMLIIWCLVMVLVMGVMGVHLSLAWESVGYMGEGTVLIEGWENDLISSNGSSSIVNSGLSSVSSEQCLVSLFVRFTSFSSGFLFIFPPCGLKNPILIPRNERRIPPYLAINFW